jgi:hypothetical protein
MMQRHKLGLDAVTHTGPHLPHRETVGTLEYGQDAPIHNFPDRGKEMIF